MLKTLLKWLTALLVLVALVLTAWYRIDGIPTAEAASWLNGDGYRAEQREDGSLVFRPDQASGKGLVIMHGALIKPLSYAKTAAWFAGRGYTVFIPYGPGRMSVALAPGFDQRLTEFAVSDWYFIGHSMGGLASLEAITTNSLDVTAVALWAAAMPVDHSAFDKPLLYIRGDTDGLLPDDRFAQVQNNLPANTQFITLGGANHKNFALYSHQFFDNDAKVDWGAQIDIANQLTADFFQHLAQE